ncbi:hypothetical protein [uncultured Methanosphaera sp.]|uniref:hypothetical protein n=1 Tax=uncultured Methanosphaera sp. TaxID=262501 RepID=UPI00259A6794|nr:hypothetical protein [uncultured Methanosphaera sp.]
MSVNLFLKHYLLDYYLNIIMDFFSQEVEENNIRTSYLSVTYGIGFFAVHIYLSTPFEILVLNINRK